ncbi:MAG: hypothetical protein WA667_16575 [Candidatus Nitrosopolaris sp.]
MAYKPLAGHSNFISSTEWTKIIDMVKNKARFREALLQLYVGKCLTDSQFQIEFLEGEKKAPDWKLTDLNTNDQILVELTEISKPTPIRQDMDRTFDKLSKELYKYSRPTEHPRLLYRGRLLKPYMAGSLLENF